MSLATEIEFITKTLDQSGYDDSELRVRKVMHGERPNIEGIKAIYAFIAQMKHLRTTLRKDFLHRCCEEVLLSLGMSSDDIKIFRAENPIIDDIDPDFDIHAVIARLEANLPRRDYGLQWAEKILTIGMGGADKVTKRSVEQMWIHLAKYWHDEMSEGGTKPFSEYWPDGHAVRELQLALVKYCNDLNRLKLVRIPYLLQEPAAFTVLQQLDVCS